MMQSPSPAGAGQTGSLPGLALPAAVVQLADQIACVERELKMRRRVYPRWVLASKLTQTAADLEMRRMEGVLQSLVALKAGAVSSNPDVEVARIAERERVLDACAPHMSSSVFLRVAERVRTS